MRVCVCRRRCRLLLLLLRPACRRCSILRMSMGQVLCHFMDSTHSDRLSRLFMDSTQVIDFRGTSCFWAVTHSLLPAGIFAPRFSAAPGNCIDRLWWRGPGIEGGLARAPMGPGAFGAGSDGTPLACTPMAVYLIAARRPAACSALSAIKQF